MFHPKEDNLSARSSHYTKTKRSSSSGAAQTPIEYPRPNYKFLGNQQIHIPAIHKYSNQLSPLINDYYNNNKQFYDRQLPSISTKIPLSKHNNEYYLKVHKNRNLINSLRQQIHKKCEQDDMYYRARLQRYQDEREQQLRSAQYGKLGQQKIRKHIKLDPLKFQLQSDNLQQKIQNLYGFEHMGRRQDNGAVYIQTQKDRKIKQIKQRNDWIRRVIQYKEKNPKHFDLRNFGNVQGFVDQMSISDESENENDRKYKQEKNKRK